MMGKSQLRSRGKSHNVFSAVAICAVISVSAVMFVCPLESFASTPGAVDDTWLSTVLLDQLKTASQNASSDPAISALEQTTNRAILDRLACGVESSANTLNDMAYVLRACQTLTMLGKIANGRTTAAWLVTHDDVFRLLLRAMEQSPNKSQCLESFCQLMSKYPKEVQEYPDLAVAFATTIPHNYSHRQPNPCSMAEAFQWYTDPQNKFVYDFRKFPFEALRFLADSRLSLADRKFAMKMLGTTPSKMYFAVPYDMDQFTKGTAPKLGAADYTLENILKFGGVCIDQAYFASEAAKATGIPATTVAGRGNTGIGHVWLAYLTTDGRTYAWDNQTARYPQHRYYTGDVIDPMTGKEMLDCRLMLVGNIAIKMRSEQESAWAIIVAASVVNDAIDKNIAADLSTIKKLADTYNQSFAKDGKPKASTNWIAAKKKIDVDLLDDLLTAILKKIPAMPEAWDIIVNLCTSGRFDIKRTGKFFDVLLATTVRQFPEYSCEMAMKVIPTIKTLDERVKCLTRAIKVYNGRDDLQSRIILTIADDYKNSGDSQNALKYYERAARVGVKIVEISFAAAEKAEAIYRANKKVQSAAALYLELMTSSEIPNAAGEFLQQAGYYKFGMKLVEIYMEMGQHEEAKNIRKQIGDTMGKQRYKNR